MVKSQEDYSAKRVVEFLCSISFTEHEENIRQIKEHGIGYMTIFDNDSFNY